jgi:hypothetical protein
MPGLRLLRTTARIPKSAPYTVTISRPLTPWYRCATHEGVEDDALGDFVVFDVIARLEIGGGQDKKNQDDGVPEGSEELGPLGMLGERAGGDHAIPLLYTLRRQSNKACRAGMLDKKRDSSVLRYFLLAQGLGK